MIGVCRDGPLGAVRERFDSAAWTSPTDRGQPRDGRGTDGPSDERQALAVLATVDGLGPATLAGLISHFGSAVAILDAAAAPSGVAELAALEDGLDRGRPVTDELARAIAHAADGATAILGGIAAAGVTLLTLEDEAYPARLRAIDLPPHVLFIEGAAESLSAERSVAVVGTRRASEDGRLVAARIGAALARAGAIVVSGLATGIDGSAQAAVVAEGGRTVGVLGGGHDRFYPRAHRRLADQIVDLGGSVVSEFAPDFKPGPSTFPRRNRIISGLADATVVVEAGAKSGALVTANWALDQGREVFLVPGSIESPTAAGCLRYLRDYHDVTRIVAGVPQLIEDLGLVDTAWKQRTGTSDALVAAALLDLGGPAQRVAAQLLAGYRTADELVATAGMPIGAVLTTLTLLEARGLVAGVYGRYRPIGALANRGRRKARRRDKAAGAQPGGR